MFGISSRGGITASLLGDKTWVWLLVAEIEFPGGMGLAETVEISPDKRFLYKKLMGHFIDIDEHGVPSWIADYELPVEREVSPWSIIRGLLSMHY